MCFIYMRFYLFSVQKLPPSLCVYTRNTFFFLCLYVLQVKLFNWIVTRFNHHHHQVHIQKYCLNKKQNVWLLCVMFKRVSKFKLRKQVKTNNNRKHSQKSRLVSSKYFVMVFFIH